ncbi:unnamed protein product, partial [Tetraodon nigroviridis]
MAKLAPLSSREVSSTVEKEEDKQKCLETSKEDVNSTSSDEGSLGDLLEDRDRVANKSGRWRSALDVRNGLEAKKLKRESSFRPPGPVLNPDFEWLKNDREAYKMAWLSHRQLTRSCLDLNLISRSPGWAQTQATDSQVISRIGHAGGSVRLPHSEIQIHIPEGHVPPGEFQEVTLKSMLDPPPGLNNNYETTMSPLVEVVLSNITMKESITLEIKLSGEVKSDPVSQVMTSVVGLVSNKREGPYLKVNDCSVHSNVMQMRIRDLKTHFFMIAVAEATALQLPATSVWDYLNRQVMVAVYGPRYIHPSFKFVIVVCCHEDVPPKLPFSVICKGNKTLPPLVLQLWGKHKFKADKVNDLHIAISLLDSAFQIKPEDKLKEESDSVTVAHFEVSSPPAAPIRSEKRAPKPLEKRVEMAKTLPITEESIPDLPEFTDRPVSLQWYGVALKSVLRQPRVEYLLEYFKGDTMALLSKETVRSVGNLKVKEWYIGFLRGRTGLVHCKNVKLITRDQVIDFTGIAISTDVLLDNMTMPFRKLTYMYSAIQTLVTEHITSWKAFANALGYGHLSVDAILRRCAETEADKVACVLEKLKEDCHMEKTRRKFLHELLMGLLRMDSMNLVAQLIQDTVILSTAVELGGRWRELAEKIGKLSSAHIAGFEAPHRGRNGEVCSQSMWKPAYDYLYSWSLRYGDSYKDMIQDLHLILDKMKNPVTRQWRQLTGVLVTVNSLDIFRDAAF